MPVVKPMEIGVMFWAGRDPAETLRELKALGVRCGQLGIPGDLALTDTLASAWIQALAQEDFALATVFAAYNGESYADIPTVRDTVGFVPPATRAEREKRTFEVSDFAAQLGAPGIACHIGALPEDRLDSNYLTVREVVRHVCDRAAKHGQTFALETGQEPADDLLDFFLMVNRENLRINFDPANMILYGSGDPIDALHVLGQHVVTVHCKDGTWPPKGRPGALGEEQPLGKGDVGMERFIAKLKDIHFSGSMHIEREVHDRNQQMRDIQSGIALLRKLLA